jgi:hypothetical protein
MCKSWLFIGTVVLVNFCAFAQTGGDITGRVNDPSGSVVPNSAITLTSTATNAVRQTESNGDGFYTFTAVPPGIYNLKVEHPGFKAANTTNIELQVQQTVRLDVTLQLGSLSTAARQ